MIYFNYRRTLALMLICSATHTYTHDTADVLPTLDETPACQVCTNDSCPCSENCRCTDNCRCRTTGCRGCCEVYTQDQELNKGGNNCCVAQHCDCTGEQKSCCNN